MGEYILGVSLGYIVQSVAYKIPSGFFIKVFYTLAEVGSFVFWIYAMYMPIQDWHFRIVHWLMPNLLMLSIFSFGKGYISDIFQMKFLKWLGDISFECFLLHQMIIHDYLMNSGVGNISKLGNLFSMFFCLIVTIILAGIVSKRNILRINSNYRRKD